MSSVYVRCVGDAAQLRIRKLKKIFLTLPLLLQHSHHHSLLTSRVNRAYIPLAALSWDAHSSTPSYLMLYFCTILPNSQTFGFFSLSHFHYKIFLNGCIGFCSFRQQDDILSQKQNKGFFKRIEREKARLNLYFLCTNNTFAGGLKSNSNPISTIAKKRGSNQISCVCFSQDV